ncbi:hypothetical protein MLP_45520 [Microlunatus phosphovorus NM-1]|uniref:ABC transporter ATP-binding protein n=1 Tax=Microlunatus phosphovorus (strain ATCC 700054 / DSM 10555 / JCM 9379 / NBRC 101784 / NCIMB 13414 / VKM Ac-1990 / NM-1) TaxID=1032480 RepID=F5XTW7_MICPN|nr:hypothetical protein MLP_45520 [Microlunatus phosphovorus NM-1]
MSRGPRTVIRRALSCESSILFADEPTGALHSKTTTEVMDALTDVHRDGTTVDVVTPDPVCAAGRSPSSAGARGRRQAVRDGEDRSEVLEQHRVAVESHGPFRDRGRRRQRAGQQIAQPRSGGDHQVGIGMLAGADLDPVAADDRVRDGVCDPDGEGQPPVGPRNAFCGDPQRRHQGCIGHDLALPRLPHRCRSPA